MNTPDSPDEVLSLLIEHSALLVHCAGIAKGVGSSETDQLDYLGRLRFAIANTDIELSCSTIVPGDSVDHMRTNYSGHVGIILRPNRVDSITFALPRDAGSQIDATNPKRRFTGLPQATPELIRAAIVERDASNYNELGVIDYSVLAVFIEPPVQYSTMDGTVTVPNNTIASVFSNQRLLGLHRGELYELDWSNGQPRLGAKVDVASLYV